MIATEGEVTEKLYFQSDFFNQKRVKIKVLETQDGLSAPKHVCQRLRDFIDDYHLGENDQLWAVIDTDHHPPHVLAQIASEVKKIRSRAESDIAISKPCFEIWFLLHVLDISGERGLNNCNEVGLKLRTELGGYNKSNPPIDVFIPLTDAAIARAEEIDDGSVVPGVPSTQIYKLINVLVELGKS